MTQNFDQDGNDAANDQARHPFGLTGLGFQHGEIRLDGCECSIQIPLRDKVVLRLGDHADHGLGLLGRKACVLSLSDSFSESNVMLAMNVIYLK